MGLGLVTMTYLSACADEPSDALSNGQTSQGSTSGGRGTDAGAFVPTATTTADPTQANVSSTPEVTSRLHGCGKLSVSALGDILASRGLSGTGPRPANATTTAALYADPVTRSALGGPNYAGRTAEAPFASTAAMAKMFDIFAMAAYDAVDPKWSSPACPGTKLLGADGKFTHDGLTCLMGKPAKPEHLAIANDAIEKNPTDGAAIAVAALLSAAHTCE
jgi:hypothetical protein